MQIKNILDPLWVVPSVAGRTKVEALSELAEVLCRRCSAVPTDAAEVLAALMAREAMSSTGVGDGVAIPHAKLPGLPRLVACLGRAARAVDFDAIDRLPVRLIFLLLIPVESGSSHLKALARISRLLKDPGVRERLLAAPPQDLHRTLVEHDVDR